jgi:hypothetical protein
VGSVLAILVAIGIGYAVFAVFRARRRSLVPKRGLGVGADLGGLGDAPRVRVRSVARLSPDRVRVVFDPEEGSEMEFVFSLGEDEFGADLLDEWQHDGSPIAMVIPPDSPLVRLRSVESLQHLTLRQSS